MGTLEGRFRSDKLAAVLGLQKTQPKDRRVYDAPYRIHRPSQAVGGQESPEAAGQETKSGSRYHGRGREGRRRNRMRDMRFIISPAKKMNVDRDTMEVGGKPVLLGKAEVLLEWMRGMDEGELKGLWRCNDKIAALNYERIRRWIWRRG